MPPGTTWVQDRQPLEGLQRAVVISQETIDLRLPLREVSEPCRDRFGLRALAGDRIDPAFHAFALPRSRLSGDSVLVEPVERFSPPPSEQQRAGTEQGHDWEVRLLVEDSLAILNRVVIQAGADLHTCQDAPDVQRQGIGLKRFLHRY